MYDLMVIGDDLSSHVAAAYAAHWGIKTALIAENGIGAVCYVGDLAFETDTAPFCGLGENQSMFSLFKEMRISPEFSILDSGYQIILPEHRIDFFNDKQMLVDDLSREFPEIADGIKSLYNKAENNSGIADKWLRDHPYIQPKSIKEFIDYIKLTPYLLKSIIDKATLKRLASGNPAFRKVMEAQDILLSMTSSRQSPLFDSFRYCTPLRGVSHFAGGKKALFDALIKKVEANGFYQTSCEVLAVKKDDMIEITYMNKNGNPVRIEGKNLIVSTKWQNMRLIIERKRKINFGDFIRPTKITHYPFTIHLGISPQCVPEKMSKHVAVVSDVNKDIRDDNLIILQSGALDLDQNNLPGKVPLSATVFLPDHPNVWSKDNLETTATSMIERLEFFLPFLKENIIFYDINESISISQKQRDAVNPKYQMRNAFFTGFAAKSNKTKFGNIYLTGASLLADAGYEGEIISGINAAKHVIPQRS
ncbi:MAG: hypothetical protein QMD11_06035 [Smithella sp.]|nr:hypothetical protein [Smithella sp.]